MNAIEGLINEARKQDNRAWLEQTKAKIKEKTVMQQKHEQRDRFIKDELGDAWIELEPYSKLISMDAYDSRYQIHATVMNLKPFSILCTSRGCQSTEKSFQLEFCDDRNLRGWELGHFLLTMRKGFQAWRKEQEIEMQKSVAEEEYQRAYRCWIDECKTVSVQNAILANNKQIEIDNPFHLWKLTYNSGVNCCYVIDDKPDEDDYWRVWDEEGEKRIQFYSPVSLENLGEVEVVGLELFYEGPKAAKLAVASCELFYGPDTDVGELEDWAVANLKPTPKKPEKPEILDYQDIERIHDQVDRELDGE